MVYIVVYNILLAYKALFPLLIAKVINKNGNNVGIHAFAHKMF